MIAARNVLIVAALAAGVAFIPGGGDTAAVVGGVLSTLILVSLVWLVARLYRERHLDIVGLGDRWRAILYVALGAIVVTAAASGRLWDTAGGTLAWMALMAAAVYAVYLVWRQYRSYS